MSLCQQCVAETGGCCRTVFASNWKILLLPGEVRRISRLTGKAPEQFVDTEPLNRSQLRWYRQQYSTSDPAWVNLLELWTRPTGIANYCPFLTPEGCSLPYEQKPFLCRVYPLEFNITLGTIYLPQDTNCRVGASALNTDEVLRSFNDNYYGLKRHFDSFRREWLNLLRMLQRSSTDQRQKVIPQQPPASRQN